MAWPPPRPGTWVLDLDGVVWRAGHPLEGAPQSVAALREAGNRVFFVTNNAAPTVEELLARLQRAGVPAREEEVLSSAMATAAMLQRGDRALVVGEPGVAQALRARGVQIVDQPPVQAVIVSRTPRFSYDQLSLASGVARDGARLIGTNDDATFPTGEGLVPGTGALLAAVATASGIAPEVAGKPYPPMVDLVRERIGDVDVVVGDRPSTDGRLAEQLETRYALVLSGVTPSGSSVVPAPDAVAADLHELVAALDDGERQGANRDTAGA